MSKRLLFGDKITMVVQCREAFTLLPCHWPGLYAGVRLCDEGVTWTRGHCDAASTQGKALLAAVALLESREYVPVQLVLTP